MNRWILFGLTAALWIVLSPMASSQHQGLESLPGTSVNGPRPNLPGQPALPGPLGPLPPLGGPGLNPQATPVPSLPATNLPVATPRRGSMRPGPLRPKTRRSFRGYRPSLPSGVNPGKLSPLPSENIRELPYLRGYSSDKYVTPPGMEMPSQVPPGKPRKRSWSDRVEDMLFPLWNPLSGLPRLPGF